MPGYLTTHVLDTARGGPAAGLAIDLYRVEAGGERRHLRRAVTGADGRTDGPILPEAAFATGSYEMVFHAGEYLRGRGELPDPPFLDAVPVRFGMAEEAHYHVPLLLSPYGYSTYRGS